MDFVRLWRLVNLDEFSRSVVTETVEQPPPGNCFHPLAAATVEDSVSSSLTINCGAIDFLKNMIIITTWSEMGNSSYWKQMLLKFLLDNLSYFDFILCIFSLQTWYFVLTFQ